VWEGSGRAHRDAAPAPSRGGQCSACTCGGAARVGRRVRGAAAPLELPRAFRRGRCALPRRRKAQRAGRAALCIARCAVQVIRDGMVGRGWAKRRSAARAFSSFAGRRRDDGNPGTAERKACSARLSDEKRHLYRDAKPCNIA
jgi:hypothetical protein